MGLPLALTAPLCKSEKGALHFLWADVLPSSVRGMTGRAWAGFQAPLFLLVVPVQSVPNLPNRTRQPGSWEMKEKRGLAPWWLLALQPSEGMGGVLYTVGRGF